MAQKPGGTAFNPLLIYGGVGLGKTHLAHAIGIEIKRNHPDKTILYVPAEKFTQQFIEAVKNNTVGDFQQFYQMMDVLIIDDVQFLAGKEKTQDVFFHIFNHLHQSGRQLVISSDKAPVEMAGMEQRLLSRFKWGLSADLQTPGLETRIAILEKKMYAEGIDLPKEVVDKVSAAVRATVALPDVKKRIEDTGSLIVANSPEEFAAQIRAEFDVYKRVVAQQKLTLE